MKRHMIGLRLLSFAPLFGLAGCGSIPVDSLPASVQLQPSGVIEGSVLYTGPRPCSKAGHIVGSVIIFAFDAQNQPPPHGTATTPVNFTVITGDRLFPNEPRTTSQTMSCPSQLGDHSTIEASGSYVMAPVNAGQYILQSFYDSTGDFFPTFKFANLPELGDVGGGYVDLSTSGNGDPPVFRLVTVGVPNTADASGTLFTMPSDGFVASGIPIVLGQVFPNTRPYFYPQSVAVSLDTSNVVVLTPGDDSSHAGTAIAPGSAETDLDHAAVVTMPQDLQTAAPPDPTNALSLLQQTPLFEQTLTHIRLNWGVAPGEMAMATGAGTVAPGLTDPFHFQVAPYSDAGADHASMILAPTDASVPGNVALLQFSPQIALTKLIDDPGHLLDPESTTAQGSAKAPIVLIQAITLGDDGNGNDSLFLTANPAVLAGFGLGGATPPTRYLDHVTGAILPVALCFDPTNLAAGGTLVTPWGGPDAGSTLGAVIPSECFGDNPTCSLVTDLKKQGIQISHVVNGCLPTGRYAINAISLDSASAGQVWMTPNESGSCAASEGATDFGVAQNCKGNKRPILYSQGNRAVVEVTAASGASAGASPNCTVGGAVPPTPAACLPKSK